MKEFPTKEGPYACRLVYEPNEIDDICVDALRQAKLLPAAPEAIRIDRFLEKYFDATVLYEEMADGIMGCTAFDGRGKVTGFMISSLIDAEGGKPSERRTRSTLAHEGGHGLLHPKLFIRDDSTGHLLPSPSEKPGFLCRAVDVGGVGKKPYDGRWWEWQANRAIAGLLLPKRLVSMAVAPFLSEGKLLPMMDDADRKNAEREIARVFDVNPIVAKIRLGEMFPVDGQTLL